MENEWGKKNEWKEQIIFEYMYLHIVVHHITSYHLTLNRSFIERIKQRQREETRNRNYFVFPSSDFPLFSLITLINWTWIRKQRNNQRTYLVHEELHPCLNSLCFGSVSQSCSCFLLVWEWNIQWNEYTFSKLRKWNMFSL